MKFTGNASSGKNSLISRLRRHITLTRWAIAFERLWPAIWPSVAIVGFYIAFSLFDPWPLFPAWIHLLVLTGCLGVSLFFLRSAIAGLRWPTENDARRRLEQQARIKHRPMDFLDDEAVALSGPLDRALWTLHRKRASRSLQGIRAGTPRAGLQYRDPRAIRALLLMSLLVAVLDAGSDWGRRLEAAFAPQFGNSAAGLSAQVWVTPPEYTGLLPQTLLSQGGQNGSGPHDTAEPPILIVPQGSILSARVEGSWRTPILDLAGVREKLHKNVDFHETERMIDASGELTLSAGPQLRARWQITSLPDQPPQALFNDPPQPTSRKALRVNYSLQDDYGVAALLLEIHLAKTPSDKVDETAPLTVELPGAETRNEPVRRTFFTDLTAHPWAGQAVEARLLATDEIGQQGASALVSFVLPERVFTHPVSKNMNYIRKSLFKNPERLESAARRLDIQARNPDEFQNDLAVFTALRSASWRLRRAGANVRADADANISEGDSASIRDVTDILWDIALRLEDGQTSASERALRDAFDEAARMLEEGNTRESFDELAEQIARLMQEFLSDALSDASQSSEMEMGRMQAMDSRSLDALLKQIQDLAAAGKTAEALELLNALRNMMENLSPAPMSAEEYRRLMEGAQAMNALENIRRQQADLKDRTARQSMIQALRERLGDANADFSTQAQEEGELGSDLEQALDNLGSAGINPPSALRDAEASMTTAKDALRNNNAEAGIAAQQKALEALAEGIGELEQQLSSSLSRMRAGSAGTDPLGRPSGTESENFPLPQESDMEAAQRILQELRDRLSRTDRPELELEYIRRLLRRF